MNPTNASSFSLCLLVVNQKDHHSNYGRYWEALWVLMGQKNLDVNGGLDDHWLTERIIRESEIWINWPKSISLNFSTNHNGIKKERHSRTELAINPQILLQSSDKKWNALPTVLEQLQAMLLRHFFSLWVLFVSTVNKLSNRDLLKTNNISLSFGTTCHVTPAPW